MCPRDLGTLEDKPITVETNPTKETEIKKYREILESTKHTKLGVFKTDERKSVYSFGRTMFIAKRIKKI